MTTKIYADGADIDGILKLNEDPLVKGFTTNPTLMKKAGITDYESFAKTVLQTVTLKPISFEVFADDYDEMYRQAQKIAAWGDNVYVKIPIITTRDTSNLDLIERLSNEGVKINVTAITTIEQITGVTEFLSTKTPSIISIFAGRIADTGRSPIPYIDYANSIKKKGQKVLWASTREVYNIVEAWQHDADIITVTNDILKKYKELIGKGLAVVSLDTVKMFYEDAKASGFKL